MVCVVLLGLSVLVVVPEITFVVNQYQQIMTSCRPAPCQWTSADKQWFAASFAAVVGMPLLGAISGLFLGRSWDVPGRIGFALGGVLVGGLVALILGVAWFLYSFGRNGV